MSIVTERALPVNEADLDREQERRIERAMAEGPSYEIYRGVSEGEAYVHNPTSHGTYTVTWRDGDFQCDCPDAQRWGGLLWCKHAVAVQRLGMKPLPPKPEPEPETDAQTRLRRMDRIDFNAGRWIGDR